MSNGTASATTQELKFRKCQNLGCDVMISFQRKTDGSNGWSAVEKDSLGQLVIHNCKGKRVPKPQQQPPPVQQTSGTSAGTSLKKTEILTALQNLMNMVRSANIS